MFEPALMWSDWFQSGSGYKLGCYIHMSDCFLCMYELQAVLYNCKHTVGREFGNFRQLNILYFKFTFGFNFCIVRYACV